MIFTLYVNRTKNGGVITYQTQVIAESEHLARRSVLERVWNLGERVLAMRVVDVREVKKGKRT